MPAERPKRSGSSGSLTVRDVSVADKIQEGTMNSRVIAQFRMESRCHRFSLPHGYGVLPLCRNYLHARSQPLDPRRANKYHLQRRLAEHAGPDRAVDLAAVGI